MGDGFRRRERECVDAAHRLVMTGKCRWPFRKTMSSAKTIVGLASDERPRLGAIRASRPPPKHRELKDIEDIGVDEAMAARPVLLTLVYQIENDMSP
ncbi:MAG: hypothetical protein RIC55_01055 [Pirellulaceae bacterium]